jgi:hypothetical protein
MLLLLLACANGGTCDTSGVQDEEIPLTSEEHAAVVDEGELREGVARDLCHEKGESDPPPALGGWDFIRAEIGCDGACLVCSWQPSCKQTGLDKLF